jgi:K+-sensing histidine kinase KdpD
MTNNDDQIAGRENMAMVRLQRERVLAERLMMSCIELMPELVLVLNRQRQILAVNKHVLTAVDLADPISVIGQRPGEALNCIHAHEGPDGCGTGEHCDVCGAALALGECARTRSCCTRECLITVQHGETQAMELDVIVAPLVIGQDELLFCVMRDITDQKRRAALERLFLHDAANTLMVVSGLTELMHREVRHLSPHQQMLEQAVAHLIEEFNGQRALIQAEQGGLVPQRTSVDPVALLHDLGRQYQMLADKYGCVMVVEVDRIPALCTDPMLLRRVLGNLIKNAIEASVAGEQIHAKADTDGDGVRFRVHNDAIISDEHLRQMFYRSFSTKGAGRGLGTYGAKLIGERYLGGRLTVSSAEGAGTEFALWLPFTG